MNDDLKIEYIMSVERDKIIEDHYLHNDLIDIVIVKEEPYDSNDNNLLCIKYRLTPVYRENGIITHTGYRKDYSIVIKKGDLREFNLNKLINEG
jgi:hypothetical protein